jgi:hypothetical protein
MKNMKTHHKIVVNVNNSRHAFEINEQQIIPWLDNMIPMILQERKVVKEKIFLHAMKQLTSFCLN